jgi:hypothetical protein
MSVKLSQDIAKKSDPERHQSLQNVALVDTKKNSMKGRIASGVPRVIVHSSSSLSLMTPHANFDSNIVNEATEEKRHSDPGVPCEIVASTSSSSASTHQSNSDSMFENETTLRILSSEAKDPEIDSGVSRAIVASTSRLCLPIPQPNFNSTFENDSILTTLHSLRRHWTFPAVISAAVIFRIMIYQRPR